MKNMIRFPFPYNINDYILWYEEEEDDNNRCLDFCFNKKEEDEI